VLNIIAPVVNEQTNASTPVDAEGLAQANNILPVLCGHWELRLFCLSYFSLYFMRKASLLKESFPSLDKEFLKNP